MVLNDVVLAERACSIDVEPLHYAIRVEMVAARELTQLHPIIVSREADTAFLHPSVNEAYDKEETGLVGREEGKFCILTASSADNVFS